MASIFAWQRGESAAIVARPRLRIGLACRPTHMRSQRPGRSWGGRADQAGQAGADACECAQEHAERALPDVALVVGRQPSLEMKGPYQTPDS
ncbi:hypothetical protein [Burkholderia ambifaria]|uniref:hypothetical protein n=1 Tax=Burkholderia ambifaria TaxID=152480 RepID=UPI00158E4A44|nr:hypothetical protein [Burkholderia ambifaria]MBR8344479.1 hypothetical protein [Burkholderia ambifaria]